MATAITFRVDVRKLPPSLQESDFFQAIKDYSEDIEYQYYVQGQIKEKETLFSRAHLNFSSPQKGQEFIEQFKQKFVDKQTNIVYEPIACKSLYQVNVPNKEESSANKKDFRAGIMYLHFKEFQEQQQKLIEQKADLSQIERQDNETEEKTKKFEIVKTPILISLEQKKKEERKKKQKEKVIQGTNQVWIPKKN